MLNDSNKLTEEMEEFAKNFKCSKCSEFYCKHMLIARVAKFKDKIDKELELLLKFQ